MKVFVADDLSFYTFESTRRPAFAIFSSDKNNPVDFYSIINKAVLHLKDREIWFQELSHSEKMEYIYEMDVIENLLG